MHEAINLIDRTPDPAGTGRRLFTEKTAQMARKFHRSFPEYKPTPLVNLKGMAADLGVAGIYVKDESYRFGLNAFKVLGGSYSIGRYIAKQLDMDIQELPYEMLVSESVKHKLGETVFVTATDGNHGRGVAWTANRLGQKSVVYMPKGSARERLENILALGAEASITDMGYDDAVRYACQQSEEKGWALIQDTSWEGYEEIPTWIMQGYTTLAYEAVEQLGDVRPTHIFLQAGVGAMAGALTGFFSDYYGGDAPVITIVEPNQADCIFRTAKADDGGLHAVNEPMNTIMAGLSCGEACSIGWRQIAAGASHFLSVPDWVAAKGMRVLGNPLPGDPRVISGESGAVTFGIVAEAMQNERLLSIRERLGLDENSRILCVSTEGDTDRENYRRIVWDGAWPSF